MNKMSKISDRGFFRIAFAITLVVLGLVVALYSELIPKPKLAPDFIQFQPLLHALLNGSCAVLLIFSLRAIKSGKVLLHKNLNLTAFCLSAIFLVSYVLYHYLAPKSVYSGDAPIKYLYYFILLTHIFLSAIVLPLILLSFWYALTEKIEMHRKIVRFSYPIWLYVAVTGVLVYLFMALTDSYAFNHL
jgi:putative membrane protein